MLLASFRPASSSLPETVHNSVQQLGGKGSLGRIGLHKPVKMSSTSQKHRDFVAEPMGEKSIQCVAGIGDVLGQRLSDQGFDKAYVLLGQFPNTKEGRRTLSDWLKETCGANAKQSRDSYGCLKEWCDAFL
ncbi:barrier-to-autointegration factor B-like [Hyperolius riggenbachi]|uniref:barrier-to-autointegration factor B-like n=1 Tax=Hyperolius riggenbachi TaxID=752182 RepID=UPI0035A2CEFE